LQDSSVLTKPNLKSIYINSSHYVHKKPKKINLIVDPGYETFEKRPLLPNSGVPDNRDLRQASTVSNFNPPPNFGGLILEILNVFVPAP